MPNEKHKDSTDSIIEMTESKEDIDCEYSIYGLDAVDCDILRGLETEEKRHAYLKRRFPEGIL